MRFLKKLVPNAYLALILVFIYLPIAILIIYSFNSLPKSFIWGGFTLDNYKSLFKGSDGSGILESLIETLKVAAIAAAVAHVPVVSPLWRGKNSGNSFSMALRKPNGPLTTEQGKNSPLCARPSP